MAAPQFSFTITPRHTNKLGPDESPGQLCFWLAPFDGTYVQKVVSVNGAYPSTKLTFTVPLVKGEKGYGIPDDAALFVMEHALVRADDSDHLKPKCLTMSGMAAFPLKLVLTPGKRNQVVQDLCNYNAAVAQQGYDGVKGQTEITFEDFRLPSNISTPFLPPDKFTVDHSGELNNPHIQAAIATSMSFAQTIESLFPSIADLKTLPPNQFGPYFLPGFTLAAKTPSAPQSEAWWKAMVDRGLQRRYPNKELEQSRRAIFTANSREKMSALMYTFSTPCTYWSYYGDQTQEQSGNRIAIEAFENSFGLKQGVIDGRFVAPGQDCEDDANSITMMFMSFRQMKFQDPLLAKLQNDTQNWTVVLCLSGVNGAQVSDGKAVAADPYAKMGGHLLAAAMRKSTLCKYIRAVNKAPVLYPGWSEKYDKGKPFSFPKDSIEVGEGTGLVSPVENDYRNELESSYRYLVAGISKDPTRPLGPFTHWKFVQWSNISQKIDPFYRGLVHVTAPELIAAGYSEVSFTPMTRDHSVAGGWKAGIRFIEFAKPHNGLAMRMDPGISKPQAKAVKRVLAMFPPLLPYAEPGPIEKSPIRSKYAEHMKILTQAMEQSGRKKLALDSPSVKVADWYPTYYQLEEKKLQEIAQVIAQKANIVDVRVSEDAIGEGLGGYRVAFVISNELVLSVPRSHFANGGYVPPSQMHRFLAERDARNRLLERK